MASSYGVTSGEMEALCNDRIERTVKMSLCPEGRPYSRRDVLDGLMDAEVPRDVIEAMGVRERNVDWEVTFKTTPARNRFLQQSNVTIKGKQVSISGIKKGDQRLRIFYLPFYVPITVVTHQLVRMGIKVTKIFQDKDRETGLLSNVWNVFVDVDVPESVPDRMRWSYDGMAGSVLVNMAGRAPKCLRCSQRGHRKFECTAPYCVKCRKVGHSEAEGCPVRTYAASVSGNVAGNEDEMDEYEEEAQTGDQPTASQSWAEQMEHADEESAEQQAEQTDTSVNPPTSSETPAEQAAEPTPTTSIPAADKTEDKKVKESTDDDGYTVCEGRKRRGSGSPGKRSGKVMAATAVATTAATKSSTPSPVTSKDSASGRRQTRPAPVTSGRTKQPRE